MTTYDGAAILDSIDTFISKYVVFPDGHCSVVVTLFAAHTHAVEKFYVTPRLVLDSAEPESAKSRVLELLALLCFNPKMTMNTTVAALYRRLAEKMLTVLFDEADAIWSAKAGPQAEDLRAFVNAGYKRGATVDRCVGEGSRMTVKEFAVFAPMAIAGLAGSLPPTVTSRAITIHMRRRKPGEEVEPYEEEDVLPEAKPLQESLALWITSVADLLGSSRPKMPAGVVDRKAEIWRALLAVADAAGGDWPDRAREACEHFCFGPTAVPASLGIRLLKELRQVFAGYATHDRVPTTAILDALLAMEEAPWGDLWGKPLDSRSLARMLSKYQVAPATFDRLDGTGKAAKGYTTYATTDNCGLADAWDRYLPASLGKEGKDGKDAGHSSDGTYRLTEPSVSPICPTPPLTSELTDLTEITEEAGPRACPVHANTGYGPHQYCTHCKALNRRTE